MFTTNSVTLSSIFEMANPNPKLKGAIPGSGRKAIPDLVSFGTTLPADIRAKLKLLGDGRFIIKAVEAANVETDSVPLKTKRKA